MRTQALTPEVEISAIRRLYEILPDVGVENSNNINALRIAKDINLTTSQATRIIRKLDSAGILNRRIAFSGKGKESYWKLLVPLNEAIKKMQNTLPPASMRGRILAAIEEHGEFSSAAEILEYIRKPGENLDPHNITHVLRALRQQGKVTFKQTKNNRTGVARGKHKEGVPYAIGSGTVLETYSNSSPESVALPEPEPRPAPVPTPASIMEAPEFPLIARLASRREFLERAAFLADEGDAKEIATMLLEAAESTKLSPFEQEVMNLWNAYKECQGK